MRSDRPRRAAPPRAPLTEPLSLPSSNDLHSPDSCIPSRNVLPGQSPSFFSYRPPGKEDGETPYILLHRSRPAWLVVNRTTLEIARGLDGGRNAGEMTRWLADRYGLSTEAAARDVAHVEASLAARGFLGSRPSAGPHREPSLRTLYLHLTDRCNLRCAHCYYPSGDRHRELALPALERWIDEAVALGGSSLILSGGEPLLHPALHRVLRHAGDRLPVRLLTNGTLLDGSWAGILAGMNTQVQISLDGPRAEIHDAVRGAGAFEKALRAVDRLQAAGLGEHLSLSTTILRGNLPELEGIIALADRLGVPLVRFLPLRRAGRAVRAWDDVGAGVTTQDHEGFYRTVSGLQRNRKCRAEVSCGLSGFLLQLPDPPAEDEIWCSVGRTVVVDASGDAYPCVLLRGERFRLGSVIDHGLEPLVRCEAMRAVCGAMVTRRTRIPTCAACPWRNLCQAGCMGEALDRAGDIWRTDPFCDYRKRAYAEAFRRLLGREASRAPMVHDGG